MISVEACFATTLRNLKQFKIYSHSFIKCDLK